MPKDPEFEYISRVNLAVIIESLLARITKDRPTEVLTHISAVAFSVKAESQAKQLKNEWPKFIAQDELLDSLEFDCFQWNENELLVYLEHIFQPVTTALDIPAETLRRFLLVVAANYDSTIPFHNFRHAFQVCQQAHVLLNLTKSRGEFGPIELLALLVSAVCHDVGHPGMNNSYQVNAVTPLAIRYNDQSVLENFHCSCTFDILAVPECNILSHLDDDARLRFRQIVIQLILATDVTRHRHAIDELPQAGQSLDWKSPQDRLSVLKNIMCMSDLNNETRSFDLSLKWGPLVQEEFYRQGDIEKAEGLPVKPMMERSARVEVEQQGFIKYLCLPLYEANAQLFPGVDVCVQNLRGNLASWEERAAES